MSYLDFFNSMIMKNAEAIMGTCGAMCPEEEVQMREKECLVHVLEVYGPVKNLVKSYSRSAADSDMTQPHRLRPYPVLKDTVQYLLLDISKRVDFSAAGVYDFVNDRLRAVRQDMTIQRLPSKEVAVLLEPMIRFYVFYAYKLCELPIKDFDPVMNKKYILECIKLFLTSTNDENGDEISGLLWNLNINYKLKCDRILVESLYILCNLDNTKPLIRYLLLPKNLKCHPKLQLAYMIALANLKGNYILVCRLMEKLCPLTYCALCIYLPILQRRALLVMSHAYSSKNLSVPAQALKEWLRFNSDAEAVDACAHYGLAADGGNVRFVKTEFKTDAPTLHPTKQHLADKTLNFTVDSIYTYTSD